MRSGFAIALICTLLFSSGYLYYTALAICPVPLEYRLGKFDDRFDLTRAEAQAILAEAEAVWEEPMGRQLFVYDEAAAFPINFIFDERQAFSDAEGEFRTRLNESADMNSEIRERYEALLAQFEVLDDEYTTEREQFEAARRAYNDRVAAYEAEGGVPPEQFEALEAERLALNAQADAINGLADELQALTEDINEVGELGNRLVASYNRNVNVYNDTFSGGEAFTQGDYQGDSINIYKFSDRQELRTVLAHEFGHALSLGHVAGTSSIMYYLLGGQPTDLALSAADRAEFTRVCGTDDSVSGNLARALRLFVAELRAQITPAADTN